MIPLIVIRAEPGASASAAAARDAGLPATACPLFEVRPAAWAAPPPDSFDALLIGSANAFRHGGTRLADYRDKPVYAAQNSILFVYDGRDFIGKCCKQSG